MLHAALAVVMTLLTIQAAHARKVVVLGVDGLDPTLLQQFVAQGKLPNFEKLLAEGDFKPLQTTVAAQSPVAWSTFITGMDPGGHGIFDFVHRDPATMLPHLSMSRAVPAGKSLPLGRWRIPLTGGRVELLRDGTAFWELLGQDGVPTTIFRMPVNFPPVHVPGNKSLSGMGTPDILGTPGTFSYYGQRLPENAASFSGGRAYAVTISDDRISSTLHGPENPFRRPVPPKDKKRHRRSASPRPVTCELPFDVFLDRDSNAAKFVVAKQEFILAPGEWSDWVPVHFPALPGLVKIKAIARFYLQQIDPEFRLYVSPMQMDPQDPPMPISHPDTWSRELCECLDYFYTQELPQDTKAFTHGVFSGKEYWDQLMLVFTETRNIFDHLFSRHDDGLFFFYFGSVDQGSHMLWHYMDSEHPGFVEDEFLRNGIERLYIEMDTVLGRVQSHIEKDTVLIVMSDHGFSPFHRGVNLNTWLWKNGYLVLRHRGGPTGADYFADVDWTRTRAYALGLNGVYVNLRGRERNGIVAAGLERDALLEELESDLLAMVDPHTTKKPVSLVTRSATTFSGPHKDEAPDLIIGYNWGYRSSWESPLGKFPRQTFVDNHDAWSGDHCIDNRLVPGVLITNRRITHPAPGLADLTVTILDEFNVKPLPEMIGRDCID
jgi:predicted AlkP superfamily phosphohydrolase/phosphomutase